MRRYGTALAYIFAFLAFAIFWVASAKADGKTLDVKVQNVTDGKRIPVEHAFCAKGNKDGGNVSPAISWSKGPEGTQSYAILMVDEDVPAKFDDANQKGKTLSKDLPRRDFYHWVLVDIPPSVTSLGRGAESDKVVKTGKAPQKREYGLQGVNDFGSFMKGNFGGYDGPCPPWNDALVHHYHFMVYALDVPSLNLSGNFTGEDVKAAAEGHILAKGEVIGTYSLNPDVKD